MAARADTAEHYRERAAEVRAMAVKMLGESERQAMLRIAESYDALALQAERSAKGSL